MCESAICKRCGAKQDRDFMHYSTMYHGIICNNSENCLKEKEKNDNPKKE